MIKCWKKTLTLYAVTFALISSLFAVGAQTTLAATPTKSKVEFIVDTANYQKVKFTDSKTGKVDYLEYKQEDGKTLYTATIDNKKHQIEKKNDKIYMDDKVVAEVNKGQKVSSNNISASASEWKKMATFKRSSSTNVNSEVATAGILASCLGGPVTGLITTMAGFIVGEKIKTVYYTITQYRSTKTTCLAKDVMKVYKVSNYTGYIGTESHKFYYCRPE